MDSEHKYLRVDVRGKSIALWGELRSKLLQAISDVLDTVINKERGSTLREEAAGFTAALLDHFKAQLERQGLENDRIDAEIRRLYAQTETERAEARKKHAEADAIELETAIKKLRLVLGGTKALLAGEPGSETLVLSRQIDAFLSVLEQLSLQK